MESTDAILEYFSDKLKGFNSCKPKETLEKFLRWASSEYYSGSPVIPDEVFDRLAESVGWNSVGAKQHEHIEKHAWPMYSLQKYYEGEGKPITLPGTDIDTSPKLDGAAISHLYIYGELVRTLTRGDGVEGTNVTDKFLATKLVPHFVQEFSSIELVQVTGELAAPKHVQNARNYAAGALNLKDVNEFKVKSLTFLLTECNRLLPIHSSKIWKNCLR